MRIAAMKWTGACVVCRRQVGAGAILCKPCGRSYDRARFKDVTVASVIKWTAGRAWKFAREDGRPAAAPETKDKE